MNRCEKCNGTGSLPDMTCCTNCGGSGLQLSVTILLQEVTAVVREADRTFEKVGGSSRHWVEGCFLPLLDKAGLEIKFKSSSNK